MHRWLYCKSCVGSCARRPRWPAQGHVPLCAFGLVIFNRRLQVSVLTQQPGFSSMMWPEWDRGGVLSSESLNWWLVIPQVKRAVTAAVERQGRRQKLKEGGRSMYCSSTLTPSRVLIKEGGQRSFCLLDQQRRKKQTVKIMVWGSVAASGQSCRRRLRHEFH